MKQILFLICLLAVCSVVSFGRGKVQGTATISQAATTAGQNSTNKFSRALLSATITVYSPTGTTSLATLYSDRAGTAKANPFTASSTDGSYFFYTDAANVDIRISGVTGVSTFSRSDIPVIGGSDVTTMACVGTNDTTSLRNANAAGGTVVIPKGVTCASSTQSLTIASIHISNGGLLKPLTGQTVTLDKFSAGIYQSFTNATAGLGTVLFSGSGPSDAIPQWWGAHSDGSSGNATATTTATQAMFNSGAHSYFFPSGTYRTNDYLKIVNSCRVYGQGESSVIYNPNLTNTSVEDISSGVLAVVGTTGVIIDKLWIKGGYTSGTGSNTHGVFIGSGSSRVTVQNCRVTNISYSGINAFGENTNINNNFIDTCAIDGVEVAKSYNTTTGNNIKNTGRDSVNGGAGIEVVAGTPAIKEIIVSYNIIDTTRVGVSVGGASLISMLNVSNNIVRNYSVYGMNFGNVGGVSFANISTNVIKESTGMSPVGQGMMLANVSDFIAIDNIIDGNNYIGLQVTGPSTRGIVSNSKFGNCAFGITYNGTGGQLRIENNDTKACTTPLQVTGTMTDVFVQNNSGYNPRGPLAFAGGDPAVPASTVGYQNLFGYNCQVVIVGGIVTKVEIGSPAGKYVDQNIALTAGQTAIVAVPATCFIKLTYSVAPTWHWTGL